MVKIHRGFEGMRNYAFDEIRKFLDEDPNIVAVRKDNPRSAARTLLRNIETETLIEIINIVEKELTT